MKKTKKQMKKKGFRDKSNKINEEENYSEIS
jgi:hypothetical protein